MYFEVRYSQRVVLSKHSAPSIINDGKEGQIVQALRQICYFLARVNYIQTHKDKSKSSDTLLNMSSSDLLSIADTLEEQDEKIEQIHRTLDEKIALLQHSNEKIQMRINDIVQALSDINQRIFNSDSPPRITLQGSSQDLPAYVNPVFEVNDTEGRERTSENG